MIWVVGLWSATDHWSCWWLTTSAPFCYPNSQRVTFTCFRKARHVWAPYIRKTDRICLLNSQANQQSARYSKHWNLDTKNVSKSPAFTGCRFDFSRGSLRGLVKWGGIWSGKVNLYAPRMWGAGVAGTGCCKHQTEDRVSNGDLSSPLRCQFEEVPKEKRHNKNHTS